MLTLGVNNLLGRACGGTVHSYTAADPYYKSAPSPKEVVAPANLNFAASSRLLKWLTPIFEQAVDDEQAVDGGLFELLSHFELFRTVYRACTGQIRGRRGALGPYLCWALKVYGRLP